MTAADLAAHAAKLCEQAARHPEIARKLWAEAMACEGEINSLRWRGFASMTPAQQRAIASKGGTSTTALGKSYRFTTETGRVAGLKGVQASPRTPERMRELGKLGGAAQDPEHLRTMGKKSWERRRAAFGGNAAAWAKSFRAGKAEGQSNG